MTHANANMMERRRLPRDAQVTYDIDIKDIIRGFLRHKGVMLLTVLAVVFLGLFWGMSQPKIYSTQTIIQMNSRDARVMNKIDAVVSDIERENMMVQTEVDLIRSPYLVGRVVDRLNLVDVPEFNGMLQKPSFVARMKNMVFASTERPAEAQAAYARNITMRRLLGAIRVSSTPRSLSINIRARSQDPNLAVKIANTLAEEYLADQMEVRHHTISQAGHFLDSRLDALQSKLTQSEQKVQTFREKHHLFKTQGRTVTNQQLSELNTQLILARANRAEKEALLRQVNQLKRHGGIDSVSHVLNSAVIQSLKVQESELARRQADMASRYGPKHPRMANVQAEVTDLQAKINQEVSRVIAGIQNDVAIARSRESELRNSLDEIKTQVGKGEAFFVELAELEREMNANRAVYEAFLSRSKETAQQKNLTQTDARIISRAVKPIRPASPRLKVILILFTFLGLCLAVAIVALIEHLDDTFRSFSQVEKGLHYVGIGMLPLMEKSLDPILYLRNKPLSTYAENLRKIISAATFSNFDTPPKVMMLTSTFVGEGKSTLTLSLAHVAAQAGQKVLVIDADMRRPDIARRLNIQFNETLEDILLGKAALEKAIYTDKLSGVDIIPSTKNTPNSNELLGSQRMDALLKRARKNYDMVLLDAPPVPSLVDTTTMAHKVDTVLFVVKWGDTPKAMAQSAVAHMRHQKVPVAGVILNQVDMSQAAAYGFAAEDKRYGAYYHD